MESPLLKHRSKAIWSPRWEAIHQEKVQTFLLFSSFLPLFDLVREIILWDVCRFASEAPAVSPTQVFSRFICPSDVEMKMVSALSSNLHSCQGSSSSGDLLCPCSHEAQSLRSVMLPRQLCLSSWCLTRLPCAQPFLIMAVKAVVRERTCVFD